MVCSPSLLVAFGGLLQLGDHLVEGSRTDRRKCFALGAGQLHSWHFIGLLPRASGPLACGPRYETQRRVRDTGPYVSLTDNSVARQLINIGVRSAGARQRSRSLDRTRVVQNCCLG
jgi:hypothetical protein